MKRLSGVSDTETLAGNADQTLLAAVGFSFGSLLITFIPHSVGLLLKRALVPFRIRDRPVVVRGRWMKLVTDYLEQAVQFERLAAAEKDPKLKEQLQQQTAAYHRLAEQRARQLGVPLPKRPWSALDDFQLQNGLQVRTVAKVAEALGRSIEDVRERVAFLGLKLGPHN